MNTLDAARKTIDQIDAQMAALFCQRMEAARVIGEYKKQQGLNIRDAAREADVVQRNARQVSDPVLREYYVPFLENTISLSCAYQTRLQEGMRIAYSGTEGAFAHIAAGKLFPAAQRVSFPDFAAAYAAVENGQCDAAVLPLENSYHGEVAQVSDLLFAGKLYVNRILELAISQDLLAVPGAALADIKTVISHPQALGQCAEYLKSKGIEAKEYANTALAAQQVAFLQDKSIAAIASEEAAAQFGLCVLEKNINASRTNTTKFAVFTRAEPSLPQEKPGVHSTLLFTVRNEAGALAKAIDIIGQYGFNMLCLRSRPMKQLLWQYYFYVEVEGNASSEKGRQMLARLQSCCDRLKVAGIYQTETN